MKEPVIAVDFDDVIAGFNMAFITYLQTAIGTKVTYDTCHVFEFEKLYGLPTKEMFVHVERFCHTQHDMILPIAQAREGLDQLAEVCELHLITSRCETLLDITCDWLSAHDLNVFTDYHFTNSTSRHYRDRRRKKSDVCLTLGAIALIDDAIHNATDVAGRGVSVLLPDRPWNQGELPPGVERIHEWSEIPGRIEDIVRRQTHA